MNAPDFATNFESALSKLLEFQKVFDGSEIHQAGLIQAFEFTFEQCWKAIQKEAGEEGVTVASPKKALEWALAAGWLAPSHEEHWLGMLKDRNLSSHTYRAKTAQELVKHIQGKYVSEFQSILAKMRSKR